MKVLIKLYPIIFLSILAFNAEVNAQSDAPKLPSLLSHTGIDVKEHATRYRKTFDSLLLEERYRIIIKLGEVLVMDKEPEINQIPMPYLICAYHYIGNSERCKKLLNNQISKYDYNDLVRMLTSSDIAYIKYFSEPQNREPIIRHCIEDYKKNAIVTDKAAGEQIIRFYINDQLYRKLKYAYKEDDKVNQDKRYKLFKEQDSIQNANIYAFYTKHGKYLNTQEVGESVSWYQPIVLSHYDNIQLRQTFFKDLLEKSVKEGRMEKTNYVHFLLRTESFTNPDFFKNLEQRMVEVRKEYDLPDYLWNPF